MEPDHSAPYPSSEAEAETVSTPRGPAQLPSDLVTVAEVAARLRVSKMTIYRMIESGELPAFRVGRSFRIEASAVRKLLSEPSA